MQQRGRIEPMMNTLRTRWGEEGHGNFQALGARRTAREAGARMVPLHFG